MLVDDLFESRSNFGVGDPVIITGNVEYQGKTGDVREVGRDGAFVVVDLYNYGPHSFHSSDVSYNDYADSDEEDERAQGVSEGPTDDPRFQRMMTGIQTSTPELMTGYVALNFASEQGSKKIRGVTQNGQPIPSNISNPDQFLRGNIKFTPDQIETKLRSIGAKYGWDSIDVGQGQGFTEMFFDTDQEYTSSNQSKLAANIVKTVAEINKFFTDINKSLQTTGLPGYTAKVWQGMGTPENINQIQDLNQIAKIAKTPAAADESADPGPALGKAILSRWAVVADDDLGYTDEEIQQLLDVANVYITKGERAGLQAQLNSDVSELIDELVSDTGAYRLRTIPYDDLDETDNSLNEFALDDSDDPTEDYPCYDCGSTIFLHHTKSCDLAEPNAKRDLPAEPGTQYWTGQIPKGLAPIPGLAEGSLNEFAVSGDGDGGDDSLFNYAKMWYNGDLKIQHQVEKALQKSGLDIGENEDENGGAYISDRSGDYYESWTAEDLEQGVAEEEKVGNMPADQFDSAIARLKKLAGAGPLKTVWDPQKRVYKNMPTAVQPKK